MHSLIRRIAGAVALLWLVLTLTFLLLHAAPGDPAMLLISPTAPADEAARLRESLGLNSPLPVQYARWMGGVVSADLGESITLRRSVASALAEAMPVSLGLGIASLVLSYVVGVGLGLVQGARRGAVDRAITIATTSLYAVPTFWLALLLVSVFTYGAAKVGAPGWLRLPAFGLHAPGGAPAGLAGIADLIRHAVLPVTVLAAVGAAGVARYARTNVADVANAEFVRTARAKGGTSLRVYGAHVARSILPSLVVLFALALPGLVAGSVFVEQVFAWPGMGRLLVSAIAARDYPLVMGAAIVYSALVIAANLAADLALPLVDPRRRA